MMEDSDDEDEDDSRGVKMEEVDDKDVTQKTLLSPEDVKFQGELADGVGRIKLKRQHSAEKLSTNSGRSPNSAGETSGNATPATEAENGPTLPNNVFGKSLTDDNFMGSPMKKHRASLLGDDSLQKRLAGFSSGLDVVAAAEAAQTPLPEPAMKDVDEEEL